MADTPDTSRATDRPNRGTGSVPLDRKTGGKTIAAKETTGDTRAPTKQAKPAAPKTNKQLEKIAADFLNRTRNKADTGSKPGLAERVAVDSSWGQVVVGSELALLALGKDYELSRDMIRHYLTGDGAPRVYVPPEAVQKAIREKFPRPGRFREVYGYGRWATPDIRRGLGHFNLDIVAGSDGELIYVVTDRYAFPDRAGGKLAEHGFTIGTPPRPLVNTINSLLSTIEFTRASGTKEKFELRKDPASGEYTFLIPQSLLADHGRDFESLGLFTFTPERR
jgi:hypothetical protein